jgi:hypothetical protein
MRWMHFCACLLLVLPSSAAEKNVLIEEVGLEGYVANEPTPSRVRLRLVNPRPKPEKLQLQVQIRGQAYQGGGEESSKLPERQDSFSLAVTLGAHEERRLDVPVLFFLSSVYPTVEVQALDTDGRLFGRDQVQPKSAWAEHLVGIICAESSVCQSVQTQISFSGTPEEQSTKSRRMKFAGVREPPETWWTYAVIDTLIVAAPLGRWGGEQRDAVEGYLRQGGRVVLVEDQIREPAFLAHYRRDPPTPAPQPVGRGKLFRTRGLASQELGVFFPGRILEWRRGRMSFGAKDEHGWAMNRLATSFVFPSLAWLLGWLGVYILVVGAVNFAVLRRFERREWGWATVPLAAVLFAAGLYAASAAKQPTSFGVDTVTLYWMDDRSPLAATEIGLRVSSPRRAKVTAALSTNAVLLERRQEMTLSLLFSSLAESRARGGLWGWAVRLGPALEIDLPLLPWSFEDFRLGGLTRMPGTVRLTGSGRLRNETGQNFREALYLNKEKIYFLNAVAPGAELELASARQEPLAEHLGRTFPIDLPTAISEATYEDRFTADRERDNTLRDWKEWEQTRAATFSPIELIRGWPSDAGRAFDARRGIFLGVADEPDLGARLLGIDSSRKNSAVTIISLQGEP